MIWRTTLVIAAAVSIHYLARWIAEHPLEANDPIMDNDPGWRTGTYAIAHLIAMLILILVAMPILAALDFIGIL